MIRWEYLQHKYLEVFGIHRLRNDVKNIWNREARHRRQGSIINEETEC